VAYTGGLKAVTADGCREDIMKLRMRGSQPDQSGVQAADASQPIPVTGAAEEPLPAPSVVPDPGPYAPAPAAGAVQDPGPVAPAPVPAAAQDPVPVADAAAEPGTEPTAGGEQVQAAPATTPSPYPPRQHVVRRTRVGGVWVGLGLAAVVLLLLLVFILENGQRADVGYFGAHGHLPLGVALLLAAVAGALLVLIPGSARIIQLRRTARRHRALDAAAGQSSSSASSTPPAP
jgi:lipopolysaccharide assembly protein A